MYQSVSWHVYEKLTLKLAYAITAGEISRTAKDNFRSGYWDKKKTENKTCMTTLNRTLKFN